MTKLPRGTKDLFGKELLKFQEIGKKIKEISKKYGYQEIETPTFEHIETFVHNNEEDLSANKEMFFIEGRKYVLKPESTASVVRSVITNKLIQKDTSPLSFFYLSKTFRHERPQTGRYREFIQFGLEKINAKSIKNDLELLINLDQISKELNLELNLKINYLSIPEVKKEWNKKLTNYFEKYQDQLTEDSKKRIYTNPLRIIDDKIDSKLDIVKNAPKIYELLTDEEKSNIEFIKKNLQQLDIDFEWDETIVRGIDYYTGLVFEFQHEGLAIIAGGRYDNLFNKFNNSNIPCLGCAIGIERVINILNNKNYHWNTEKQKIIYLGVVNIMPDQNILKLLIILRKDITVISNWDKLSLKEHFSHSEKINASFVLIYGEKEKNKQEIVIKNQINREQEAFKINDIESIKKWLEK